MAMLMQMDGFSHALADSNTVSTDRRRWHSLTQADVNELLLQFLTSQPDTSQQEEHRGSCRSGYI